MPEVFAAEQEDSSANCEKISTEIHKLQVEDRRIGLLLQAVERRIKQNQILSPGRTQVDAAVGEIDHRR